MWFFPTKKQIKKELKKISKSFNKTNQDISHNSKVSSNLKSQIDSNKVKIARLEGAISVLLNQKSQSQSQSLPVSKSITKSQPNIETKLINRVRRSKKAIVMAEISKLTPSLSVIDIFDIIVREKGLCSKASFYRYVASLKSQPEMRLRQ